MNGSRVTWNWRFAGFGAVMALVAVIVILSGEVLHGTFLLIGSIPAAIVGLAPTRKERRLVLIVGLCFAASILLGSMLALWVPLAIVGMFAVSYGAARVAAEKPAGVLALSVIMPLTAIGLTYTGIGDSARIAGVMALGSIGSFLWALVLPEYEGEVAPKERLTKDAASWYGLLLGVAAALATAVAFALDVEFVGWLVGSTMLVMRPTWDMLNTRGIGRVIFVVVGGLVAALILLAEPSNAVIAVVLWLVLVLMAATSESRWYITPAFTSFLILWALLYGKAELDEVTIKFRERVWDTLIGVAVAYVVAAAFFLFGRARRNAAAREPH